MKLSTVRKQSSDTFVRPFGTNVVKVSRIAGFLAIALAVSLLVAVPVGAHGGGSVRGIWDDAVGFHMVVETNEDPAAGLLGGVVHVTMIPTATAGSTTTLRGMDITVSAVGPEGRTAGPIRARHLMAGYEADLMVDKDGVWRIWIEVGTGETAQQFQFPLEVLPRSLWTDIGIVGGLMMIPVFGIMGMVRMRRRRQAGATNKATPTGAVSNA